LFFDRNEAALLYVERTISMLKCTALLLFAAAVLPAQSVLTTGIVGITDGQTVQINVLNPGVLAPALGVICSAAVELVDDSGNVLKTASLTILPGQSKSLQIRSDTDLGLTVAGDRKQIRAVVASPGFAPSTTGAVACKLVPTLEILDTVTGKTQITLTGTTPVPGIVPIPAGRNP
jgi:hypothetical protein